MWLVHVEEWGIGPSGARELITSRALALRCNKEYRIGRSEQRGDKTFNEIRVEKKSISRTAGLVRVGEWPGVDDEGEPSYQVDAGDGARHARADAKGQDAPTLTYTNEVTDASKAKKPLAVHTPMARAPKGSTDIAHYVRTSEVDTFEVGSGTFVYLTAAGTDVLRFEWRPCVIRGTGGTDKFVEQRELLGKYGIHLAHKDIPHMTHIVAPVLDLTARSVALGVSSGAHLVLDRWVDDLVRAFTPPSESKSLHAFKWPDEGAYLPELALDALEEDDPRCAESWWEANEVRRTIWRGKTVVLLSDRDVPPERAFLAASGAHALHLDINARTLETPADLKKRLKPHLDAAGRNLAIVRRLLEKEGVPESEWPAEENKLVVMAAEVALDHYMELTIDVEAMIVKPAAALGIPFAPLPYWWRALTTCDWRDVLPESESPDVPQSQAQAQARPQRKDKTQPNPTAASSRSQSAQASQIQSQAPATFIPSTHPEEAPTQAAAPAKSKASASKAAEPEEAASPPPAEAEPPVPPTTVRKPLKRRAGREKPLDPLSLPMFADDNDEPPAKRARGGSPMSCVEETPPRELPAAKEASGRKRQAEQDAGSSKPGSKLKRRAGGGRMPSIFDDSIADSANALSQVDTDPLAKYRDTYNKSRGDTLGDPAEPLEDEPMEVEEEDFVAKEIEKRAIATQQEKQRRMSEQREASQEVAPAPAPAPIKPKQAPVATSKAVAAKTAAGTGNRTGKGATQKANAAEQEPTRDESFLQVVGKARKGAKEIDDFDKDFNALKIDKRKKVVPTVAQNAGPAQAINYDALVADLDPEMTGNFVVMEKRPLLRTDRGNANRPPADPAWAGKPNFKKFKKQHVVRRQPVSMTLAPAADYGIGGTYWAEQDDAETVPALTAAADSQTQTQRTSTQFSQATVKAAGARKRRLLPLDEDSEGENMPPAASASRSRTQMTQSTQSQARPKATQETAVDPPPKGRKRKAPEPRPRVTGPVNMSLNSDSDDPVPIPEKRARRGTSVSSLGSTAGVDDLMTGRSTRSSTTRSGAAIKRRLLPVDDEDEDQVIGGRTRRH